MPLSGDTIIVERLASDLSAEFGVLLAPTVEYGVNVETDRGFAGNASIRKKTLHRMLNDLVDTWESTGIREFILMTAHEHDPHLEAMSTVITTEANVLVRPTHDRMPVLVDPSRFAAWLDPATDAAALRPWLASWPADEMVATPANPLVNNARNDAQGWLVAAS